MSSSTHSNISQNNAKILKQWQEMQQRYEKQQQLLLQLEEAVRLHHAEHVAQKARGEVEENAREEAERQRIVEKKKKLEYIQWLQNEVLEKEAALLERAEGSQVVESKCKEIATGDKEEQWPSKKAKGKQQKKYHRSATIKMGDANLYERCVSAGQNCLAHYSR